MTERGTSVSVMTIKTCMSSRVAAAWLSFSNALSRSRSDKPRERCLFPTSPTFLPRSMRQFIFLFTAADMLVKVKRAELRRQQRDAKKQQ
jgi:hypothetical protein